MSFIFGEDKGSSASIDNDADGAAFKFVVEFVTFTRTDVEVFGGGDGDVFEFVAAEGDNFDLSDIDGFVDSIADDGDHWFAFFSVSNGADAVTALDDTVVVEDLLCGFEEMFGEDAEVGHHEDAIDGEHGDAFWLIGIHHHESGLGSHGGVGENSAATDDHVEFHHFDEG